MAGTPYTRQSAANITSGNTASAADVNAEFNKLEDAFDATTGHDHSGAGNGAPIPTAGIEDDAITYAKVQNVAADNVLLGNDDGAGSAIQELTAAEVRALLNVEDGADITDEASVTAALDGATLTAATIAAGDKVLIQDADGSDALKTVTTQAVADLYNVTEGDVTAHETALTITESQISDLGSYETADADILKADTADTLTAGFKGASYDAGTKTTGTFTPDADNGNFQEAVNGGAHTLGTPVGPTSIVLQYTNNASAGAINTSAFNFVAGSFNTVDGDVFQCTLTTTADRSSLVIVGPM